MAFLFSYALPTLHAACGRFRLVQIDQFDKLGAHTKYPDVLVKTAESLFRLSSLNPDAPLFCGERGLFAHQQE
jgi:hypothetical protein